LLVECKKRNIKVLLDLILNHCSIDHPFIKEAISSKKSKKRDWFLFYDTLPSLELQRGSFIETKSGYYFANFSNFPDFNLENPEVLDYFINIANFWLDTGCDGFRLDAIRHLVEIEHKGKLIANDTDESVDWMGIFSNKIKEKYPNALLLGEIWSSACSALGVLPFIIPNSSPL